MMLAVRSLQRRSSVSSMSSPQHFSDPCIFHRRTNSLEFTACQLQSPGDVDVPTVYSR